MAKIKTHRYSVPSSHDATISVQISEPLLTSENLGLETWASSHILASQLHHLTPSIRFPAAAAAVAESSPQAVLPVLELGAGTGLVGISAAALWDQLVVLTDLAPIVPGLEANIALNATLTGCVQAGTLDWKDPTALVLDGARRPERHARVIFAADTIYSPEHPELLVGVVGRWLLKDPEARFVMAYPLRGCYIEEIREMWERLEGEGLEVVQEGRQDAEEDLFDDERLVEWSVWKWKGL